MRHQIRLNKGEKFQTFSRKVWLYRISQETLARKFASLMCDTFFALHKSKILEQSFGEYRFLLGFLGRTMAQIFVRNLFCRRVSPERVRWKWWGFLTS